MKKIYVVLGLLLWVSIVRGQTYLLEDFSSGQMPPTGWTIQNQPNQWSAAPSSKAGGTAPEGKFSYIQANTTTRLISPVVDLTGLTSVTLMFSHFYDWYANPAPVLGVATRSGVGTWTSVWEITPTGNVGPNTLTLAISNADVGAGFQFCFYLTGNFYNLDYWFVDDIYLMVPPQLDGALTSIKIPQFLEVNDSANLTGKVKNMGATNIHSFDVAYSVEGGAPVVASFSGLDLATGQSYAFTHDVPLSFPDAGSYAIFVKIQNVNGGTDNNPANDTLTTHVGVLPWIPPKKIFCEEATGTWCGWCVRGICNMDYMAENYPDTWIGVAVHNGDPMVVPEWDDAIPSIIPDFPGYPSGTINRKKMWDPEEFEQGYQEEVEALPPATVDIMNFAWNPGTRVVSFDVVSEFVTDIFSEVRFGAIIIEDSCFGTGTGWAQTNYYAGGSNGPMCGFESMPGTIPASQMHYDHVGRAILDSPFGTPGSIPQPVTAGSVHSHHYEYTIPATWVYENLRFVGLLMDQTNGIILNANNEVHLVGANELGLDMRLRLTPNPASGTTTVRFSLDRQAGVHLQLVHPSGKIIKDYGMKNLQAGDQRIVLDLSSVNPGFYILQAEVSGKTVTHKIMIY